MVLVVGGKSQGKTKFAKDMFPEFDVLDRPSLPELISCEKEIIWDGFNHTIRNLLEDNSDEEIASQVQEVISKKSLVIVSDEIGNGIVPLEMVERRYRDLCGKLLIKVASESDEVYRVICGIGQKIK